MLQVSQKRPLEIFPPASPFPIIQICRKVRDSIPDSRIMRNNHKHIIAAIKIL